MVCSAHPNMFRVLEFLREQNYSKRFGLYVIIPDIQSYVRLASQKGMLGLIGDKFKSLRLINKAETMIQTGISTLSLDPHRLLKTYLDVEVSSFAKSFPLNAKLKSVFVHEILTELMISFEMKEFARDYVAFAQDRIHVIPGFVTRNFPRFLDFMKESEIPLNEVVVLTPFNKVGFQMNPSKQECENALSGAGNVNVIAMSLLAGGYLSLVSAVNYLKSIPRVNSCVIGVSTESHARETFATLKSSLD